ncbi:MBL fold metallo-hydrolase [Cohnella candidum]|uniref:MBL fold metallo-hydrolase n=1 Tax=Cohnella candidum TaxID=2674991 RepID=A0A3G3JZF6_9BACL|nr:MBL fold metallo-hydrolase [Cohnella candidum]AYQ73251.1 MBL fold metallo-hydrolase [Cohnella candidum]
MSTGIEHPDGWLQVKIPLPYSLKWVNAYLLPGPEGWTLIDPGLRTSETERIWTAFMEEAPVSWNRIAKIVLTHHHPDHYGLAGWFRERTGANVWMSETARAAAVRMWGENETYSGEMLEAFREHGLPSELAREMQAHLLGFRERVSPQPEEVRYLEAGKPVAMGGVDWEPVAGEGHAPGHLSFYDRTGKRLICGDQVLPDISPNIGWMPGGDGNPLASYLSSLESMRELDVEAAYPGHRDPFGGFRERVDELLRHHERRLDKIAEGIGDEKISSFDVCERLFGTHLRGNLHNLRFALAETIAHLILLETRGVLARDRGSWQRK